MVLQNKYKARASRRYNAARGGLQDGRGRGRGRGGYRGNNEDSFPSLNPDEDGKDSDEEEGEDETNEAESPGEVKGKYSRRKLESNAWRYQEEEVDPHQGMSLLMASFGDLIVFDNINHPLDFFFRGRRRRTRA